MFKFLKQNSYWKLFWHYMYVNWQCEIAYRLNFWMYIASEIIYFVVQVLFLYFIFESGGLQNIGGYSIYDFYFVFVLSDLIGIVTMAHVVPSMVKFKKEIHDGRYDLLILRPRSWFITSIRRSWLPGSLPSLIYTVLLFIYVFDKVSLDLLSWDLLYVFVLLVYGYLIFSLLYWVAGLVCLYFPKFDALHSWLETSQDIKLYPSKIYPRWMVWVYRTVLPLMLIANPVYDLIDGKIDGDYVLHLVLVMVMFVLLVMYMWKDGIKRYESAA